MDVSLPRRPPAAVALPDCGDVVKRCHVGEWGVVPSEREQGWVGQDAKRAGKPPKAYYFSFQD